MELMTRVRLGVELAVGVSDVEPVPPPQRRFPGSPASSSSFVRVSDVVGVELFSAGEVIAELGVLAGLLSELAGYEAALVDRLAELRPAVPDLPGSSGDWVADEVPVEVSEWAVDELQLVNGTGRAAAARVFDTSLVLRRQLPATWAALADAQITPAQARAVAGALGGQGECWGGPVPDAVVAEVEAQALGWARSQETPGRLKERVAGAIIAADAAAADRRRRLAERASNVFTRATGDGMSALVADMPTEDAVACQATVDRFARLWKADGDDRPIGQLRALTLRDLILRPWDARSTMTATVHVVADLDTLDTRGDAPPADVKPADAPPADVTSADVTSADVAPAAATWAEPGTPAGAACPDPRRGAAADRTLAPGAAPSPVGVPAADAPGSAGVGGTGRMNGQRRVDGGCSVDAAPVTSAQVRRLLARLEELAAVDGFDTGCVTVGCTEPGTGRLLAVSTLGGLRRAARAGEGLGPPPEVDRYTPSAEQRRFVAARDLRCRFPGCRRDASGCDADHVIAYADGGRTVVQNLISLCRRHHRLKTHAPGWAFWMEPDGTMHIRTPTGVVRTTRPPGLAAPAPDDPAPF